MGNFGACFFPPSGPIPTNEEVNIYASRPGLRLWNATIDGKVTSTMMFKDSITKCEPPIETIDLPTCVQQTPPADQKQFGTLITFFDKFLVSWQGSCLWVIDPSTGYVIGCHNNLGNVVDVAVTTNELFVLSKGENHFVRLLLFETCLNLPCIVVEDLDLNNPKEIEKAQRSSSINRFEDQDKLDRILDGVGSKVKIVFSDVKCRVKEIKEQIKSREGSEDDRTSDASSPARNIVNNGVISSPGYSTSEEKSSTDKSGNESDTSSTETEQTIHPFESSLENDKSITLPQLPDNLALPVTTDSQILFDHLSKREFPSDIVFEGSSRGGKRKKKSINPASPIRNKDCSPIKIDDSKNIVNETATNISFDNNMIDKTCNIEFKNENELIKLELENKIISSEANLKKASDSPDFYFSLHERHHNDDEEHKQQIRMTVIKPEETSSNNINKSLALDDVNEVAQTQVTKFELTKSVSAHNKESPGVTQKSNNTHISQTISIEHDFPIHGEIFVENFSAENIKSDEYNINDELCVENNKEIIKTLNSCDDENLSRVILSTEISESTRSEFSTPKHSMIEGSLSGLQTSNDLDYNQLHPKDDKVLIGVSIVENKITSESNNLDNYVAGKTAKSEELQVDKSSFVGNTASVTMDTNLEPICDVDKKHDFHVNGNIPPTTRQAVVREDYDELCDVTLSNDSSTIKLNQFTANQVLESSELSSEYSKLRLNPDEKTQLSPSEKSNFSFDEKLHFSPDMKVGNGFDISGNVKIDNLNIAHSQADDMNVVNVKISHQRQGSNVSVQSLGHERCKEVRGEANEGTQIKQLSHKVEKAHHPLIFTSSVETDLSLRGDNSKLYPISPFPAPQMQSIYQERRTSLSEFSFSTFDDKTEEERLFADIGEYDRIDVHADLIESVESITDVEDNLASPPINVSFNETGGIAIKKKRRSKNKFSLPSSPCSSDMEGRPLHSPKAVSEVVNERLRYLADSWADVDVPTCGQLQHIACSATLLWSVDQHDHVFFTPSEVRSGMHDYVWKKVDGRAVQVACNQLGTSVWCVDRQGVAYYRTAIRENNPQGSNWLPFEKDIHYVAVDTDSVWAIKANGDVFVRTGVSPSKPSGSGWITIKVASDLVQLTCLNGLIWALDVYNHVQIFQGDLSSAHLEEVCEASNWCELPSMNASHVMLGAKNVCWVIDRDYGIWFNEDISKENPLGGTWYQLSLGEHQAIDSTWFSSVLSYFRKGNEPKMVVANVTGVFILGKQGTLHVAHGHLLGTRWEPIIPSQLSESSCWTCITAGGADMNKGFIWALQPNGQLFCFKQNSQSYNVHPPTKVVLKYCSTGPRSLWALTAGPDVYVRVGISDTCPQGLKWLKVNMIAQNNKRLNGISCGNLVVWAVDFEGNAWFQMSRSEDRSSKGFSPAWVSVEGCPLDGSKFIKITVGPDDRIVWACDEMNNVYSRKDVSENFWIGTSWEVVSGTSCKDLAISRNHVWGLCPNGDVICRFGVSYSNVLGDYWKKVPGNFEQISVSANDELWGIDRQGHLYQRQTMLFYGSTLSCRAPSYNDLFSDHNDWELI